MDPNLAGRLAEPFVLALLKAGPAHGYALLKSLEEAFGDGAIAKARVYQILRRLEEDGAVTAADGTGNRKEYRLTPAGQEHLAALAAQGPAFHALLATLFPGGAAAAPAGGPTPTAPLAAPGCPGCAGLRIRTERTLDEAALHIDVAREGAPGQHRPDCPVGQALVRLLGSLLP